MMIAQRDITAAARRAALAHVLCGAPAPISSYHPASRRHRIWHLAATLAQAEAQRFANSFRDIPLKVQIDEPSR